MVALARSHIAHTTRHRNHPQDLTRTQIRHSALASRLQLTDPSHRLRVSPALHHHTVATEPVAVNPYTPHQFDATVWSINAGSSR